MPATSTNIAQRFYVANATYITSTTLLKLSLLCQYLRIFKDGILRTSCFVLISFCLVWGCISSFMAWFPCFPIKAYWDWSIVDANCYAFGSKIEGPFVQTYVSHAAFNLVLDFAILVLPAPIIFQKALSGKQKLSALGLGAMGMLVIAFCAWRLAEVVIHGAGFKPVMDFTY